MQGEPVTLPDAFRRAGDVPGTRLGRAGDVAPSPLRRSDNAGTKVSYGGRTYLHPRRVWV